MSKQSNEVYEAADLTDPTARGLTRRDRHRPNRDEFAEAQRHADEVLGLDEKVSDGLRRAMKRFKNSPLTLYMEILNDDEQPWERRLDAAERAKPFLHRKLEDKHGTAGAGGAGQGAGAGNGSAGVGGPTINLTLNRPAVTVNTREREVQPATKAGPSTAAKHEAQQQEAAARPKAFKKPKKVAK